MKNKKKLLPLLILLAGFYGCYNDNAEDLYPHITAANCDTANVTYAGVIQPVIATNCVKSGCHLGVYPTGYDLSDYSGLAAVAGNGKLVAAIEHTGPNPMPQDAPKLDDCTIAKIKKWVTEGAQDN